MIVNTNYRDAQEKYCQSEKHIKRNNGKGTIVSKKKKKLKFPLWFKHSMSIPKQLIPIYNTTVHKNKSYVALIVLILFVPKVLDLDV